MLTTTDELTHLSPAWAHLTTMQPVRGEGAHLYDADGARWLDFTSGIGVTNTGHSHPRVVAAIQAQAASLIHGQITIVIAPAAVELSHKLNAITPDAINCFFFSNSGAEATEGAVKLARHATKRTNIIVFQGSFHGRTAQTMAMTTSKTSYRAGYQPLPSGVFVTPFPYAYRLGMNEANATAYCIEQLRTLLKAQTAPEETAAIVIEPVLGEGGYVPAPPEFLRELRALCDQTGIMLVIDEVQTGFGRTGAMFALEHAGITPDIMIMAKGLGSGVPISAIGAPRELMARWSAGAHGGTYGGNALATAAACATIDVLLDENLPANAARMGARLIAGLRALQAEQPAMGDVRGLGLMIGVEFVDAATGAPDSALTKAVQNACLEEKLLLLTCGTFDNVIRWIPPLVVDEAQIDHALAVFARALERAVKA